ncbi:hypothetical protein EVG20_g2284, partial [Dentipellis fragilis]
MIRNPSNVAIGAFVLAARRAPLAQGSAPSADLCDTVRCQRADWKQHRNVYREPEFLDIGAWISAHEPELKWASAQALGGLEGLNLTSTHGMVFRLVRSDRLPAERSTGPFVMFDAIYMSMEEMASYFPMDKLYSESDHEESAEIKRNGGFGVAFAVFEIQ